MSRRRSRPKRGCFGVVLRLFGAFVATVAIVVLVVIGVAGGMVAAYARNLPDISRMADFQPSRSTRVYSRDHTLLATLANQNRIYAPIAAIPVMVREAFIATEDAHFYQHHGVDFGGIARAALADYRHERFQGASTITQQLARDLFLTDQVSIQRKLEEALLAIEIERYYTKDEILERYLNLIYFGSGAYGIQAAAHTYFGTNVENLTVGQAAMLAGMPAAPSAYSPYVSLKRARERQAHVLDRMVTSGYITRAVARREKRRSLGLIGDRPTGLTSFRYPYFTTFATQTAEHRFGKRATFEGGLEIDTTLDIRLQKLAQKAVDNGLIQARRGGIGADQAALVAIRPQTGEILAMIGGSGFSIGNQFNRAWQAHRQPGSSFKPYVYTAAIDTGYPPTYEISDSPVSYRAGDGSRYSPQDDDNRFLGPVSLSYALAQSRNVVAVKLAQRVGIERVIEYAHRMGVTAQLDPNLSLALGTSVVTPLDQAAGYATLADQGIHIEPTPLRVVRDSLGSIVLDQRFPEQTEVISAGTAYVVTTMLEGVIKHGTGTPNAEIDRPAAGKTGTTSDFRDAWFVGYTPDLVAAVWLGNDNYHRMNESYGGNIPARIWAAFMKSALENTPKHDFAFPSGEVRKVAGCGGKDEFVYFLDGTQPKGSCAYSGYTRHAFASPALPVVYAPR